jgi:hypothetical protein
MSFDVYLKLDACTHCGRGVQEVYSFNLTHNVNSIVEACLVASGAPVGDLEHCYPDQSWGRLHGYKAGDMLPVIRRAYKVACDPAREVEFRAMEPPNMCGSLASVRLHFRRLLAACEENPTATIAAWG